MATAAFPEEMTKFKKARGLIGGVFKSVLGRAKGGADHVKGGNQLLLLFPFPPLFHHIFVIRYHSRVV